MPQYDLLKDESKEVFLNSSYRVSFDSNRVRYRFEGPQLLFKEKAYGSGEYGWGANGLNDEDSAGLIQVAADGEVICTGPDFVAASGRIPIGHLIAPDVDRVAQLRPKDHIKFKVVTQDDARLIFDHSMGLISEANILST
jgi:allophanate hydrolase subunit 2